MVDSDKLVSRRSDPATSRRGASVGDEAFELRSRQKMQSSFRLAQDDEI